MRRRQFLGLAASAAVPAALAVQEPSRIGSDDVTRFAAEAADLVRMDDRFGGADVYGLAVSTVGQLRRVSETATYSPQVGRQLGRLVGETCHHAGWLAYDSGRQAAARAWWLEALHAADVAEDDQTPTLVYASMSMQARDLGNGREAVQLARRALKASASLPRSRRLRSLLLVREADGHVVDDPKLTAKTYAHVEADVDAVPDDDDPAWIGFWGRADFAAGRAVSAQRAGDLSEAVAGAREAVAATDPVRFPRNHTSYTSLLGAVLVEQGDLDEGIPVLVRATMRAGTLGSARIRDRLNDSMTLLKANPDPVSREFREWADRQLPST